MLETLHPPFIVDDLVGGYEILGKETCGVHDKCFDALGWLK